MNPMAVTLSNSESRKWTSWCAGKAGSLSCVLLLNADCCFLGMMNTEIEVSGDCIPDWGISPPPETTLFPSTSPPPSCQSLQEIPGQEGNHHLSDNSARVNALGMPGDTRAYFQHGNASGRNIPSLAWELEPAHFSSI